MLYKMFGVLWGIDPDDFGGEPMSGPYCPNCRRELDGNYCSRCNKRCDLPKAAVLLEEEVWQTYLARKRESLPIESLDEPPTQVKVKDEDDNYFLSAKIGIKNGKRVGVVYFGEKKDEQSKKDYAQVFIDLDDEEVRSDKSNSSPIAFLSKMTVEFRDSTIERTEK